MGRYVPALPPSRLFSLIHIDGADVIMSCLSELTTESPLGRRRRGGWRLNVQHFQLCVFSLITLTSLLKDGSDSCSSTSLRPEKWIIFTPVLMLLHWLPIYQRFNFGKLLLVRKDLTGLGYISALLVCYEP